ncbi:creatininase family protein [Candidatus Poribacteria bacterium]|nr:creatininase family protein [Candidatus Poribacteria bacterium]
MTSRAATEYCYEKLTWPEINDAVELGNLCILPVGAIEQHGPHLPLDMDVLAPTEIARAVGRAMPEKVLVLPTVPYGYTAHVMDFPGTINIDFEHFIHQVLDIAKSLAYHGFKKIILLNGHGSNIPNLDLVARRTNLETTAECVALSWWTLLTVDKAFLPRWRQSRFPGGCAHAGELETAVYLYLDGDNVRHELNRTEIASHNLQSEFNWVDLFAAGPAPIVTWTSTYTASGVCGESELATAEKGREAFEEAVKQLGRLVEFFHAKAIDPRRDQHRREPDMPIPWGLQPVRR